MKIESNRMVPLGYGKYYRSDRIVGMEPLEDTRGPGRRTRVWVQDVPDPIVASRSESSILRDMVSPSEELASAREMRQLLGDILDTIDGLEPMLRNIVRGQAGWDLDRLERRIRQVLKEES